MKRGEGGAVRRTRTKPSAPQVKSSPEWGRKAQARAGSRCPRSTCGHQYKAGFGPKRVGGSGGSGGAVGAVKQPPCHGQNHLPLDPAMLLPSPGEWLLVVLVLLMVVEGESPHLRGETFARGPRGQCRRVCLEEPHFVAPR